MVVAYIADGAPIVDEVKDAPGAARYVETDKHVGTKQKVGNKGGSLLTPSGRSWPGPGLHDLTNFRKVDLL